MSEKKRGPEGFWKIPDPTPPQERPRIRIHSPLRLLFSRISRLRPQVP